MPDGPGTDLYIIRQDGSYYHDTGGISGGRVISKAEYNQLLAQNPDISTYTVTMDQFSRGDYKLPPSRKIPTDPSLPGPQTPKRMPNPPPPPYDPDTHGFPGPRIPQLPPQAPIYSIPSGEVFNSQDDAMRKSMYNDLMAQQVAATQGQATIQPIPAQPVPAQSKQPIPLIPKPANNQAMQNYSNILQQGVQNYASQMGNPNFGMPKPAQQKNISTPGYPSPKPFG